MVEKEIRDGLVAVLISHGYGAGWSTWADDDLKEFCLFDKGLVALAEKEASQQEIDDYIEKKLGPDNYLYTGGWGGVKIHWVPVGTSFRVEEYDGAESLTTVENLSYTA